MSKTDNMFLRMLDIFAHFVMLNALWMVFCIPMITIFPATTALFKVVQQWTTKGTDVGVLNLFITSFKKYFKKSFVIGLLWLLAGVILFVDLSILSQVEFTGSFLILILLMFSMILYIFVSMYALFLMVQYDDFSVQNILKHALILSVSKLHYTLLFLVIIAFSLIFTYYVKVFLLMIGSVLAFVLYHLFQRLDHAIEAVDMNE